MVKPILQTYPVIHAESEEEREKLRPVTDLGNRHDTCRDPERVHPIALP